MGLSPVFFFVGFGLWMDGCKKIWSIGFEIFNVLAIFGNVMNIEAGIGNPTKAVDRELVTTVFAVAYLRALLLC